MIPAATNGVGNTPTFVDVNGDGLLDVIYNGSNGTQKIRLNTRIATGFAFGVERAVNIDSSEFDTECAITSCSFGIWKQDSAFKLQDFNGDGASDLIGTFQKVSTFVDGLGYWDTDIKTYGYLLIVKQVTGTTVELKAKNTGRFLISHSYSVVDPRIPPSSEISIDPPYMTVTDTYVETIDSIDINGDGLTDILFRKKDSSNLTYMINNGNGFATAASFGIAWGKFLQLVDVNGDGRTDVLFP